MMQWRYLHTPLVNHPTKILENWNKQQRRINKSWKIFLTLFSSRLSLLFFFLDCAASWFFCFPFHSRDCRREEILHQKHQKEEIHAKKAHTTSKSIFYREFSFFAGEAIIKRKTQESKSSRCFDIFRHAKKWRKMLFNSEFHSSLARPKTQEKFFTIGRSHFLLLLPDSVCSCGAYHKSKPRLFITKLCSTLSSSECFFFTHSRSPKINSEWQRFIFSSSNP